MTTRSVTFDLKGLRWTGIAMLSIGAVTHFLPTGVPTGLPCPLRALTGVPCPLCGMTTSVVAAEHAHFATAAQANPFGIVAVIVAIILLVRPKMHTARFSLTLIVIVTLSSWVFQLHRFHLI